MNEPVQPTSGFNPKPQFVANAAGWRLWFSRHNWLTWLGLCFVIPLVLYYWQHYANHLRQQQQAVFEQYANNIELELSQRLKHIELLLSANVAFLSSSEYVSQTEWQHYVKNLNLSTRYPGIQALGIVSYRPQGQLTELLAKLNHELSAEPAPATKVHIYPSGERPFYAIISHIQPMSRQNRAVLGFDILTDPLRRQTAMRAASLDQAAITGKVLLQQDEPTQQLPGLVLMLPFYQAGLPLVTAEQKQTALQGFVYAAFRIQDILPASWHDPTAILPDILWHSGTEQNRQQPDAAELLFDRSTHSPGSVQLQRHQHLDWYGQPFVLEINNNHLFESVALPLAEYELILLASAALVLLFLLLSYLNLRRYQVGCVARMLQQQIQQQRQALLLDEQRQSLALKASQLAWFEFDFRTGGAFYADVWWQMFDFVSAQPNPEPQQLFDLLHPTALATFRQDLQRLLANGPDQYQQQYRFVSRQGRQLYCQVNFYVVRAFEGDAIRLCCTIQDLTLQQHQQHERQQFAMQCLFELTQAIANARLAAAHELPAFADFLQQHCEWLLQFYAQRLTSHHSLQIKPDPRQSTLPVLQLIRDSVLLWQADMKAQDLQLVWQSQTSSDLLKLERHGGWQLIAGFLQLASRMAKPESQLVLDLVPFQTRVTFRITLITEQVAVDVMTETQEPERFPKIRQQELETVKFWAAQLGVEFSEQQEQQQLTLQLLFP